MISKDLLVIGGGPGGLVSAMRGAQKGLDVLMAERRDIGGVCLNRGCIPSKSLKRASDIVYGSESADEMGINAQISVDYSKTIEWTRNNIGILTGGMEKRLKKAGVRIKKSEASFIDSGRAEVGDEEVEFENCVVATGSSPNQLPFCPFDSESVLNSDEFFDLDSLPEKFLVVGAGYIGMEIGMICNKLGSEVTILEALDQILPIFDKKTVKPISRKAKEMGMDIKLNRRVDSIESEKGEVEVRTKDGEEYSAEKVLLVCGRSPNTEGLNLEATDVELTEGGFLRTDDSFRTDDPGIYAVGDVVGGKMLAHEAYNEAVVAVESIFGGDVIKSLIPEVVFTDPELARVGEFREENRVGEVSLRQVPAAYTKNELDGQIRVSVDDNDVIKGGEIVGPMASEIIHQIGIAIQNEMKAEDIIETVHAHPTISEGVLLAVEDALDSPVSSL
ncbi:MAG: dihydrolipoyl dehydrogenase [Candidatus Hadarchaeia archaeon]